MVSFRGQFKLEPHSALVSRQGFNFNVPTNIPVTFKYQSLPPPPPPPNPGPFSETVPISGYLKTSLSSLLCNYMKSFTILLSKRKFYDTLPICSSFSRLDRKLRPRRTVSNVSNCEYQIIIQITEICLIQLLDQEVSRFDIFVWSSNLKSLLNSNLQGRSDSQKNYRSKLGNPRQSCRNSGFYLVDSEFQVLDSRFQSLERFWRIQFKTT